MATTTDVSARIDRSLDAVLADLSDLPHWLEQWNDLPDGERASLSLEWDHMMGDYLPELAEFHAADAMSTPQAARYEALLRGLRDALPFIERLNFYRPPVELPD